MRTPDTSAVNTTAQKNKYGGQDGESRRYAEQASPGAKRFTVAHNAEEEGRVEENKKGRQL